MTSVNMSGLCFMQDIGPLLQKPRSLFAIQDDSTTRDIRLRLQLWQAGERAAQLPVVLPPVGRQMHHRADPNSHLIPP